MELMDMMIKQIRVIDPAQELDEVRDLYLDDGIIVDKPLSSARVIDGRGLVAAPGLIDLHVHLRDPGLTHKEDIFTGTKAAAAGGYTAVACMPNTAPSLDSPEQLAYVAGKAQTASARVLPIAAVTVAQAGVTLTNFKSLRDAGAIGLSDDGFAVESAALLRQAMQEAAALHIPIISHCEDTEMVQNHAAHEGFVSKHLKIPGRPAVAETIQVARDLLLAEDTGCHIHIAHVSTAKAVELIRRAKADGIRVTAETCPQYFTLTEEALLEKGTLARVNPPLRTEADREAILAGLLDGTIDTIVTDHAPHSAEEKAQDLLSAPSGMVGLETILGLSLTALYHTGKASLSDFVRLLSTNPAQMFSLPYGTLRVGAPADVTIFDPDETWTVEPEEFLSKARNTPFGGMELRGRVRYTICGGVLTYER